MPRASPKEEPLASFRAGTIEKWKCPSGRIVTLQDLWKNVLSSGINYIQCPYCQRRFNENAADRHINFCKEQAARISNKGKFSTDTKGKVTSRTQCFYRDCLQEVTKCSKLFGSFPWPYGNPARSPQLCPCP
ncbi:hypothetical protein GH733_007935 [Mirounga leonina]|nr:hypothetical protein GH733_007935 [Mirounga leonina]